jgi:SAM-dependent methyltransferase
LDWRLKCLAFHALSVLPGQRALYSLLQRRVTGRYFVSLTDADLHAYGFHTRQFRGGRALEFGSGSNLLTPLLLSAAGATEVLAYDIQPLATVEQINHAIVQLRGRVAGDWPAIGHLDDLQRLYRIRYCAPGDARDTGLAAGSVDFICSTSVLEHISQPDIEAILAECRRIANPNALLSFVIDYHDHYATADSAITRFNFYKYEDWAWRWLNPDKHYQNRLRHSDFERMFEAAGYRALENRAVFPPDSPAQFTGLAARFRRYSWEDLVALNGFFVLGLAPT